MSLEDLFCEVDDFCRRFGPDGYRPQGQDGECNRRRGCRMVLREIMTLLIHFHQSPCRDFQASSWLHVCRHGAGAFPQRLSDNRLVAVSPTALVPLCVYLQPRQGPATGITGIAATSLVVCHNRRIYSHQVFHKIARRGKTAGGWFYGFKLHLVVQDCGELWPVPVTPGHPDDRNPGPRLVKDLTAKLFGDRGSLSPKLIEPLGEQDLQLIPQLRQGMHNKLLPWADKLVLRTRALIETINDQLKNISQIEHTRHRSVMNRMVNLLAGGVAYPHQPQKPSLHLSQNPLTLLNSVA